VRQDSTADGTARKGRPYRDNQARKSDEQTHAREPPIGSALKSTHLAPHGP
jgi:hypothetical protein